MCTSWYGIFNQGQQTVVLLHFLVHCINQESRFMRNWIKMGRSGYTCVRHLFCSLNVFIWIVSCGILGVGIWLRLSYANHTALLPQFSVLSADSLIIASGAIMFIVAFFGCCGSWFQSRCMLITYFSLVIFMFLVEFLFATLAFVFRENLNYAVKEELKAGIDLHYNGTPANNLENLWSHIHTEFHCCGVNGYEDWYDINAWPGKNYVPNSCCLPQYINDTDCGMSGNQDKWYHTGCSGQIQMWFVERLHIVGVVGLVLAFIQLFGLISSMLLFCTVRHRRTSHTYKSYDPTTWPLSGPPPPHHHHSGGPGSFHVAWSWSGPIEYSLRNETSQIKAKHQTFLS